MSRLCVKNIGKNCTVDQLRDKFSSKGEVTDVKIVKTKSGKSREFAFVGFHSDEQAQNALKYFNNTFLGTSKISVEVAGKKVSDESLLELANAKKGAIKSRHTQSKLKKLQKIKTKEEEGKVLDSKEKKKSKNLAKGENNKGQLQEFMQVMKNRNQVVSWDNDANMTSTDIVENSDSDSDDDINDMTTRKSAHDSDDDDNSSSDDDDDSDNSDDEGVHKTPLSDMDFLKSKVSKNINKDSDNDSDSEEEEDEEDNTNSIQHGEEDQGKEDIDDMEQEKEMETEESEEKEGGRVFVRNIPFTCTEEELTELFEPFGTITETHVPVNKQNKRSLTAGTTSGTHHSINNNDMLDTNGMDYNKYGDESGEMTDAMLLNNEEFYGDDHQLKYNKGFGFVQYMFPESAIKAIDALDGSSFQGRVLHLMLAKKKRVVDDSVATINEAETGKMSSYKLKLEAERKKMMNKMEGWNSSYVRSDAVIDSLAQSYGVKSGDLIDSHKKSAGDVAITMAVGENQIIQENKDFFGQYQIDLSALESFHSSNKGVKRSTTTLLVKNLKHDSDRGELENMFGKFGTILQFLMPPSNSMAYVEYMEATDARLAFKSLAYKRYHNMPLYLEWAPLLLKNSNSTTSTAKQPVNTSSSKETKPTKPAVVSEETGGSDTEYGTIYIKNLNFDTRIHDIENHLTQVLRVCDASDVRKVVIPTKGGSAATTEGKFISMGYGFIELKSTSLAKTVLQRLHNSILDGHRLEAKLSEKRLQELSKQQLQKMQKKKGSSGDGQGADSDASNSSCKIVIRNLAFQTTLQELKKLCSIYGNIKSIRLPKKVVNANNSNINQHRGFAFVEYNSKKEAEMAYAQLKNIHLYGRHLVCEYASSSISGDDDAIGGFSGNLSSNAQIYHGKDKQLQQLRKKAGVDMKAIEMNELQANQGKKRKFDSNPMDEYDKGTGSGGSMLNE